MRIHGICLTKNEADIVELFLRESAIWCDAIHVFDNGSDDGTWQIVQRVSREESRVIPFKRDECPFDNALRAEVFNAVRASANDGDWWCRLDTDEFYARNPRQFLSRVPPHCHVVWAAHCQFYLTPADVERLGPEAQSIPPRMSWENLPRHYSSNASEARFFRHRDRLSWTGGAWPAHLGVVCQERIPVRHFQYRSPAQIQRRLNTRLQAIREGNLDFPHVTVNRWEDTIQRDPLRFDKRSGPLAIDEAKLPRHLDYPHRELAKRMLHGLGIWP